MPLTDQITEIAPYFRVTIKYKYHAKILFKPITIESVKQILNFNYSNLSSSELAEDILVSCGLRKKNTLGLANISISCLLVDI